MEQTTGRPSWLVTGASGFLGANLGTYLRGRAERIGVSRSPVAHVDLFDRVRELDLRDAYALQSAVEEASPTVIVHSAAMASHEQCEQHPDQAHAINVDATRRLAALASKLGSQFVLISTDAVFDGARGRYSESDEPSPTSVYGQTKLLAERAAAEECSALIIRTNFFGWSPTGNRSILEFFVNALGEGLPVQGFTDFTTTSAYAQVLTETLEALVTMGESGTFHVTSPDALSKYAFGVAVAEIFGLDPDLITPTRSNITPPRTGDISLSVDKVQGALSRTLPTQVEGLRRAARDALTLRHAISATPGP